MTPGPTISEQRSLVWRYIWSTALIVATIGVATLTAKWTELLR
jgi:hypothetical protein